MTTYEQHPSEVIAYAWELKNDTIASATFTITPTGPTLTPQAPTEQAVCLVGGLVFGTLYTLSLTINGASGQRFLQHTSIRCR